jgi:hypothetical protein
MNINEQLLELYSNALHNQPGMHAAIESYNENINDKRYAASWPLLLSDNNYNTYWPKELTAQNYQTADIKIIIFGQETMGWGGQYGHEHYPKEIMNLYEAFFTSGEAMEKRGGCFWHAIKSLIKLLKEKNKDKNIGYLWNNVVKIGYNDKGFPEKFYNSIVKPYFNHIIPKELEILKPDYAIFFTGPNYDHVINDIFNNPPKNTLDGFEETEFCKMKIPNIKKSLRTYHPTHLSHRGSTFRDNVLDKITKEL